MHLVVGVREIDVPLKPGSGDSTEDLVLAGQWCVILDRILIKRSVVVHHTGHYISLAFLWNHLGAGGDGAL